MKNILFGVLLSVITILTPIKAFIILIGLFVCSDTAIGIYSTIKLNGIDSFRSNKLFNIVIKTFFYMASIILAFGIDKFIFDGQLIGVKLLITKAVTLLFSYIEVISINETSQKLGNKSIWLLLKEMIGKGKQFKKDLGELIDDDDETKKE